MLTIKKLKEENQVAPLAGVWIEITVSPFALYTHDGRSLMGVWIEISLLIKSCAEVLSLPHGSVD